MSEGAQRPVVNDAGAKHFFSVFFYLWALLTLVSLCRAFLFREVVPAYPQGFALLNAFILANAVLAARPPPLGEGAQRAPILFPALAKSAIFSVLLIALQAAEETGLGVWGGKSAASALPGFVDGALQTILMSASFFFVALIPLLLLIELEAALAPGELAALIFGRRAAAAPDDHIETHFLNSQIVRDVVIGMADGLTVPFALAAGISAAIASTRVVVTAGLAEIVAGSIAMGLGGYLAARSDQEHFLSEEKREWMEVEKVPERERNELREIFAQYGLKDGALHSVVASLSADKQRWVDFMMRFELGLEKPDPKRAPISAATIASAYFVGGLIPLAPYMIETDIKRALISSAGFTGVALIVFGAVKGRLTGANPLKSGFQTLLVGGLAAGAAYYLASLFG